VTDLGADDGRDPDTGTGASTSSPSAAGGEEPRPARRPGQRRDPAAMRETLDAARRRLGADPKDGPQQSAARQRALLREAVANQSAPWGAGPGSPGPRGAAGDADRGGDGDATPDLDAGTSDEAGR